MNSVWGSYSYHSPSQGHFLGAYCKSVIAYSPHAFLFVKSINVSKLRRGCKHGFIMKSKGIAYLLWFFLGFLGVHKFYLGKIGVGILYLFTFGLFGIGLLIDLFTLGGQVDTYNALFLSMRAGANANQSQNVVVNIATPVTTPSTPPTEGSAPKPEQLPEGN